MFEESRPTRAERKEQAYLERIRRDAAGFRASGSHSDAEIQEIRRWEGAAAAEAALRARRANAATPYTRISRETPTRATSPSPSIAPGALMPTNGFAIVSLVLGIIGGSVLAVVFGHLALSQIERTGEQGRGLATAGLVLGYLALVGIVVVVIAAFAVPAAVRL